MSTPEVLCDLRMIKSDDRQAGQNDRASDRCFQTRGMAEARANRMERGEVYLLGDNGKIA